MNREEELAKKYLETLSPESLEFEPDGNIPPDFLLNGNIAIEVTRLNEHIEVQGILKRIDDDSFSITELVKNVLHSYESSFDGRCFWVAIDIRTPFGNRKRTKKKLVSLLQSFQTPESVVCHREYTVTDGLTVSFTPGSFNSDAPVFRLGAISQHETGGWVYDEVSKNTKHCISTKSSKIKPYREIYKEWWLVLVDSVAYGNYSEYFENFKETIGKGLFEKIIVLEALDGKYVYET